MLSLMRQLRHPPGKRADLLFFGSPVKCSLGFCGSQLMGSLFLDIGKFLVCFCFEQG